VEIIFPTSLKSTSQKITGPQAKEIDPEKFLLSRSALFNSSERIIPNNSSGREPNKWPTSMIPMRPPSAAALHGQIAALQKSQSETVPNKDQVASSVALLKSKKLKPKGGRVGDRGGNYTNRSGERIIGRTVLSSSQASTVSSSLAQLPILYDPNLVATAAHYANVPQINALSRIEVTNSKLLKQFEDLDREIRSMQLNQQQQNQSQQTKRTKSRSRSRSRSAERKSSNDHQLSQSGQLVITRQILDQDAEAVNAIRQLFQESIQQVTCLRPRLS
jgi:hypothetical protein